MLHYALLLLSIHQLLRSGLVNPLTTSAHSKCRQRISINHGWKFNRWENNPDGIIYDHRADTENLTDVTVLKPWILPSGNEFISDAANRHKRPVEDPEIELPYAEVSYDDGDWQTVSVPHDWAIAGPFVTDPNYEYAGMGRLPSQGIGWYRRSIAVSKADLLAGHSVFLEFEGAMSYAMIWVNGRLVGGWPYGYNSFRLDVTAYLGEGMNLLAVRLDNPQDSARWYPGGGLYRNVWLEKTSAVRVAHYGTYITSRDVSQEKATVDLQVQVQNFGDDDHEVDVITDLYIDSAMGKQVASSPRRMTTINRGETRLLEQAFTLSDPLLWGPMPLQTPNVYIAGISVFIRGHLVDYYETQFGIRNVTVNPDGGLSINNQHVPVYGVNNHHDLGALGAAFNVRAAERQLEGLLEMGCNALRTSHNPPAPELLNLTDRMGLIVLDEIFDSWKYNKTDNDFHLIFPEWHEPDTRAFVRRDRNHPSVIAWSYGNEVYEQNTNKSGAVTSLMLKRIVQEEDPTRQSTASINAVGPDRLFPGTLDILSLNYRGAGIRDTNPYSGLNGTSTPPQYMSFHDTFPDRMVWSTESASTLSTRGSYLFPVIESSLGAPINDSSGGDEAKMIVSDTGLYTADYGQSPDRSFLEQDKNPYVAGEFVWTGWDYIGEPTPYYTARSSYSGIIDLAGFRKDRFFEYQARWRPDWPMAHLLPHWNWPEREGLVTPVHVFTSGDEAELFVNGESHGRRVKGTLEYRLRWDEVRYEPGEICVVAYKHGERWATATRKTAGPAAALRLSADRDAIVYDGLDLSFLTVEVVDERGNVVPTANETIYFAVEGTGSIVGTDNGFPGDFVAFPSLERRAFNGLALAIVKARSGSSGPITVSASAAGMRGAEVTLSAALSP